MPKTLQGRIVDRDSIYIQKRQKPNIVVYYNLQGCSSCKLKELLEWKILLNSIDSLKSEEFYIKFVMNVGNQQNKVTVDLIAYDFRYSVFYDLKGNFEKLNKLPWDPIYHTFLLDKNNKVILVGSPIHNDKMWNLYKKTINTLIANNGVMPQ